MQLHAEKQKKKKGFCTFETCQFCCINRISVIGGSFVQRSRCLSGFIRLLGCGRTAGRSCCLTFNDSYSNNRCEVGVSIVNTFKSTMGLSGSVGIYKLVRIIIPLYARVSPWLQWLKRVRTIPRKSETWKNLVPKLMSAVTSATVFI